MRLSSSVRKIKCCGQLEFKLSENKRSGQNNISDSQSVIIDGEMELERQYHDFISLGKIQVVKIESRLLNIEGRNIWAANISKQR